MERNVKNSGARKSYQKPCIQQVKLEPEEAVLAGCKILNGRGPSGPDKCSNTTPHCQLVGS